MKWYLTLLLLLFFVFDSYGQNMVLNPSFEQYLQCPTTAGQLVPSYVANWDYGTNGTSDYYNSCSSPLMGTSVPENAAGYQPSSGNAYAGILAYEPAGWREYIKGGLTPLSPGTLYKVTLYVNLANVCKYASSGLGVFFYQNGIGVNTNTLFVLPVAPQVDYTSFGPIADTQNWVTLVDTFYADSAYSGLIIGNFNPNTNTTVATIDSTNFFTFSYYYIDSVSVEPFTYIPLSATISSTDNICNGGNAGTATVTASNGLPPYTYNWQPGNFTSQTISNLAAGTYTCTITDATNASITQSVTITEPLPIVISTTNIIDANCGNQDGSATVSVSGGTAGYTYQWLPYGGTAATAYSLGSGIYTVQVTDANNCTNAITITIDDMNTLDLSASATDVVCYGESSGSAHVIVTGGQAPLSYLWNNGEMTQTVSALSAGNYTVTVTDANGCKDTVGVTVLEPPALELLLSATNTACTLSSGSATVLVSGGVPGYTYSWLPYGGNGATATGLGEGVFTVTVRDVNDCIMTDSVPVNTYPLPLVNAGEDVVYCYGKDTLTLQATGAVTYDWSPADGLSCTSCAGPGAAPEVTTTYQVTGTDINGCQATDEVTVHVLTRQPVSIGTDQVICSGDSTRLFASGGTVYSWYPATDVRDNASPTPLVSPTKNTTYTVVIKQNECFTDTLSQSVTVHPMPSISLGPDINTYSGASMVLTADTANALTIDWQPPVNLSCSNCPNPLVTVEKDIRYEVTVSNGQCIATDSINISVSCSQANIFLANSFTPNDDQLNDYFYPQSASSLMISYMAVYDRWGERVFEQRDFAANEPTKGWDGTYKGKLLSPNVYVYYLQFVCGNGERMLVKGDIALVK